MKSSDRALPHSLEAERSILGAVLLHTESISHVDGILHANDFFRDAHRRIFEAMLRCSNHNVPIDLTTLKEELDKKNDLDEVGGPSYISALIDGVPRSTNIEHYARIVVEKAQLRELIYASNKILADAYAGESEAADVLANAEASIYSITQKATGGGMLVGGAQMAQEGYALLKRLHGGGTLPGLSTGLQLLDADTLGLHPNHLTVVAARPGKGKSAFMLHLARHLGMRLGQVVAIFSLEMGRDELILRTLAAEGRVAGHRMNSGHISGGEYGRLGTMLNQIGDSKLYVDDTPGRTIVQMRSQCRRLTAQVGPIGAVFIDYLQLMTPVWTQGRQTNREQDVNAMAWGAKMLAKELHAPVVLLSQLNRIAEHEEPRLSHLRESGGIEQHADDVWFTHPPEDDNGTCGIIIAKQRNGPKGHTLQVGYDPAEYRFWNLATHEEPH
jgi:replicative DNA helicase